MSRTGSAARLLVLLLAGTGCRPRPGPPGGQSDSATVAGREARLSEVLSHTDSGTDRDKPVARWLLSPELNEISGLALTPDGRLLVNGDETARIWEIDYRRGTVVKRFEVGSEPMAADFEGATVADESVFLLTSGGRLYQFREGAGGTRVKYLVHKTKLGDQCEFEGLAFAPAISSLLLACKTVRNRSLRDSLVIFRWNIEEGDGQRPSRLTVPLAKVIGSNRWKEFHPSDITVDPTSGNYVLIASQEKAMIAITPAGEVVFARPLPGTHEQPEGVAITKDSILIISDEKGKSKTKSAVITLYRWPLA